MSQAEKTKVDFGNDEPIESREDDHYDFAPSAERVAEIVHAIETPSGCAVALYGKWGSGKTSFINLVRRKLKSLEEETEAKSKVDVINFRCWEYRSNETLMAGFLREVPLAAPPSRRENVLRIINKIMKHAAGPAGILVNAVTNIPGSGATAEWVVRKIEEITSEDESIESLHESLVNELRKEKDKRILMIIDDIDRLSPDKALTVFELIKTIGRLPNVMYLFAFDPDLINKVIESRFKGVEGRQYFDKIIQTGFFIPKPAGRQLMSRLASELERLTEGYNLDALNRRRHGLFSEVFPVLIKTPRDVYRLSNTLSVTWRADQGLLNYADFAATESLRIFRYDVYKRICTNRILLVGLPDKAPENLKEDMRPASSEENPFKHLLEGEPEDDHDGLMRVLGHLFPRVRYFQYKEMRQESALERAIEGARYDGAVYDKEYFERYFWTA